MNTDVAPKSQLHLRVTYSDWLDTFQQCTSRIQLGVLMAIRALDPFGDRDLDIDVAHLSKQMGCHRTSISRALEQLSVKGLIDLTIRTATVKITANNKKLTYLCADATDVHPRTTSCADAQGVAPTHNDVHPRTTSCADAQNEAENPCPEGISEPLKPIKQIQTNSNSLKQGERENFEEKKGEEENAKEDSTPLIPNQQNGKESAGGTTRTVLSEETSSAAAAGTSERNKYEWEIVPGQFFPDFIRWRAVTQYEPQGGRWKEGARGHAIAEIIRKTNENPDAVRQLWQDFLEAAEKTAQSVSSSIAAGIKVDLPKSFVPDERSTESVAAQLSAAKEGLEQKAIAPAPEEDKAKPETLTELLGTPFGHNLALRIAQTNGYMVRYDNDGNPVEIFDPEEF